MVLWKSCGLSQNESTEMTKKSEIVEAGATVVGAALDAIDGLFYVFIALVIALFGAGGWLIYLLVY